MAKANKKAEEVPPIKSPSKPKNAERTRAGKKKKKQKTKKASSCACLGCGRPGRGFTAPACPAYHGRQVPSTAAAQDAGGHADHERWSQEQAWLVWMSGGDLEHLELAATGQYNNILCLM